MDAGLVNFIKNEISNDFCKLICNVAIEFDDSEHNNLYIFDLMNYCILYDATYFIEDLYKEKLKNSLLDNLDEEIDLLYLYYLKKNNKENLELKNEIIERYVEDKKLISKEIKTLKLIDVGRKKLKSNRRRRGNAITKKYAEINLRFAIIANCLKYKFLIENLNLEDNKKLDRLIHWNVYLIKKSSTIENKLVLM